MKPLLASAIESEEDIKLPCLVSPKMDGIRCLILDGKAVSRSLKPIPNNFVREQLEAFAAELVDVDLDGELMIDGAAFNEVSSGIMSHDGEPKFTYYVFDSVKSKNWDEPFESRLKTVRVLLGDFKDKYPFLKVVTHVEAHSLGDVDAYEQMFLDRGYEGIMLRSFDGVYKHGRSTVKQGILLKVKRFVDAEATIVDFNERMHNDNEATINALGHIERSSHKANKRAAGDLGAFVAVDAEGVEFKIGAGFTAEQRKQFWADRDRLKGKLVKFKYLSHGSVDRPRHPIFLGFRHPEDLS